MKDRLSKIVALIAILVSIYSGNDIKTSYDTTVRWQAKAEATYTEALEAFNAWQTSVYPVLESWVTYSPVSVVSGLASTQQSAGGAAAVWIAFILTKLRKKEEEKTA